MGYRSDVRSIIRGSTELVTALLVRARLEGNKALESFDSYITKEETEADTEIYLEIDDIKWYDADSDVRDWEKLLQIAEDMQLEWEFIRSGEDNDDVDHRIGENKDSYEFWISKTIMR
jgi:hypothetical protein